MTRFIVVLVTSTTTQDPSRPEAGAILMGKDFDNPFGISVRLKSGTN